MVMKKTLDQAGRILIPKEIRDKYNISLEVTELEIIDEGEYIALKKVPDKACHSCRKWEGEVEFENNLYCKRCIKGLIEKLIE